MTPEERRYFGAFAREATIVMAGAVFGWTLGWIGVLFGLGLVMFGYGFHGGMKP